MNALLGVLLAAIVFAVFIFVVDRSAKYLIIIGLAAVGLVLAAIVLGVGR